MTMASDRPQDISRRTVVASAGIAGLAAALLGTPAGEAQASQAPPALVGTWMMTNERLDVGASSTVLSTFLPDGAHVGVPGSPTASILLGRWTQRSASDFSLGYVHHAWPPGGPLAGQHVLIVGQGTIQVNGQGDQFTLSAQADVLNDAGEVVRVDRLTGRATRLTFDQA